MRRFNIEQSDADIVSHSGLALIGQALNNHSGLGEAVDKNVPLRHGISHSDVLFSYPGLLRARETINYPLRSPLHPAQLRCSSVK